MKNGNRGVKPVKTNIELSRSSIIVENNEYRAVKTS